MKRYMFIAAFLLVWTTAPVFAQASSLPFNVNLGDDVATVKSKLKTEIDPEPIPKNPALPSTVIDVNKGKTILRLRTKGMWAFFNKDGKVETIRFDAPFDGSIKGIKLGDDEKKLISSLGNPITKPNQAFGNMTAYRYVLDDSAYITFDLNDDGVQYIFINK